jgi:Bifunctional DNA primase/polymerase, N-terminal
LHLGVFLGFEVRGPFSDLGFCEGRSAASDGMSHGARTGIINAAQSAESVTLAGYDGGMATRVERRCEQCDRPMSITARSHARTCSPRCRKARSRAEQLPRELVGRDRWVRRSASKVPLTVEGGKASSTDPSTWASHRKAKASTVGAGLGYVLAEGDGIACIDLDHCLVDGVLASWAQAVVDAVGPTFMEVSPSGSGLHLWCRSEVGQGRKIRRGGVAVEVYGQGRYIAMGRRYKRAPLKLAKLSLDGLLKVVDSLA